MLLGHDLLTAARLWRFREVVEIEAAMLFARLAQDLSSEGAPSVLVDLAARAAEDEREHAGLCRQLVREFDPDCRLSPAEEPRCVPVLGPPDLEPRRRALYASVAMSCITETLSAALLLEIRRRAQGPARKVASRIAKDEVRHSQLGWAHLAWAAERTDVSWLSSHVPAMVREALRSDVQPMAARDERTDLSALGILPRELVEGVAQRTLAEIIFPGLARFGVKVS